MGSDELSVVGTSAAACDADDFPSNVLVSALDGAASLELGLVGSTGTMGTAGTAAREAGFVLVGVTDDAVGDWIAA